jgi:hypothetical protein
MSKIPRHFPVISWLEQNASMIWNATGGALIVLFLSIVNQKRRSGKALIVDCLFGAIGSSFIGYNFHDQWWAYPGCGIAAIMTQNVCLAFFNLSERFRDDPVNIISHFIKLFVPNFGSKGLEIKIDPVAGEGYKPYQPENFPPVS